MTYRDDLAAAHARIAALEEELADAGGHRGEREDLRVERDELASRYQELHARSHRELAELRGHLARLREEHQQAQRELAELRASAGRAAPEMPTSVEHNRAHPRLPLAAAAGVVCPRCAALGDRVELGYISGPSEGLREARCPRCAAVEIVRLG